MLECSTHGMTSHALGDGGRWRCRQCRVDSLKKRRQERKELLVLEAGGKCSCSYDRSIAALQFHHRDPSEKLFDLNQKNMSKPLEVLRAEAKKCDLLCSNCHSEIENDLDQARAAERALNPEPLVEEPGKFYGECLTHQRTEMARVKDGKRVRLRCKKCNVEAWQRWYWKAKDTLIEEAGGKCVGCGYNTYRGALEFHHRNPEEKSFSIGKVRKSIDEMREEIKKCDLLCSNCHAEHHADDLENTAAAAA